MIVQNHVLCSFFCLFKDQKNQKNPKMSYKYLSKETRNFAKGDERGKEKPCENILKFLEGLSSK